jgi:hypothetical protein
MAHLVVAIVIALIGIAGGFLKLANARDRVRADLPSGDSREGSIKGPVGNLF